MQNYQKLKNELNCDADTFISISLFFSYAYTLSFQYQYKKQGEHGQLLIKLERPAF